MLALCLLQTQLCLFPNDINQDYLNFAETKSEKLRRPSILASSILRARAATHDS
jgi:hypothetical protein